MKIASHLLRELQGLAAASPALECCGVLWASSGSTTDRYAPHPGPLRARSFRFDWDWWLKELYRGRERGWSFQGLYHSHPMGESLSPSLADRKGHPKGSRVLILPADSRSPEAYLLKGTEQTPERLELELVGEHFSP